MLKAEGLAAFRGERLVLENIGFEIPRGGALLLHGPNGVGKSTLLRLLAGLLRPAAGTLLWNGDDALGDPAEHARRVAYLGHQDAVKPAMTAAENLRFPASLARASIADALAAVGLAELADLPARMFSAGQRRRLALARVTLSPAPLWLLDEPATGLDAASISALGRVMTTHCAQGGLIVASTHAALPLPRTAELRLG